MFERLTPEHWWNNACYDTWEICGLDYVCKRDCREPVPCKIPQMLYRLAAYENTKLTPEQIEAQQQEIEQLKEVNRQLMWENISDNMSENITAEQAEQIKALTADKDEQAGRIMELDSGLERLRLSLQWLYEINTNRWYKEWAKEKIAEIDALLGGKEDERPNSKRAVDRHDS